MAMEKYNEAIKIYNSVLKIDRKNTIAKE